MKKPRTLYRVRFQDKGDEKPLTVVCETFHPSEIFGLVTLEDLVIDSGPKLVVLPDEDEVAKRYKNTERLHLPFHVLVSVEEFQEEVEGAELHVIGDGPAPDEHRPTDG